MKLRYLLFFLIIAGTLGCSGSAENPAGDNKSVAGVNANSTSGVPDSVQPPGFDNRSANRNSNVLSSSFSERNNRKRLVDTPAEGPPPPLRFTPAPENSEIATTMTADGQVLEYRNFMSHPQLARVEAAWIGNKARALKIYLRDGRVIDVQTEKIANLKSASSKQFLELAGISPEPPAAGDKSKKQP